MNEDARASQPPGGRERAATVVCFGEVLWDCLPRGIFLGGAPINAAYHLAKRGLHVVPVTAVGRDFLGDEAVCRMRGWGLDLRFVSRVNAPTGTVRAQIDEAGVARYEIARGVAWDRIVGPKQARKIQPAPVAIVHGTLALRGTPNRRALRSLFTAWPEALRVVDLNLRDPFATQAAIDFALAAAQLVKLNDDELARLTGRRARTPAALCGNARRFAQRHGIDRICVTAGARGAGLWWGGEWHWEPGRRVVVRDTVGSGDAFLGGLLGSLLEGAAPSDALVRACRLGEFVATRDGATPDYDPARIGG
jgi:fructokinase